MFTLLGISLSFAAPITVGADVPLRQATGPTVARLMLTPAGAPRVLIYGGAYGPRVDLLLPTAEGWSERPFPRGSVVMGKEDLVVLLDPVAAGDGSAGVEGQLELARGRWVARPGPALPEGAYGAATLGPDGRAQVMGWEGTKSVLLSEGADGTWSARPVPADAVHRGWAEGGALWWLSDQGMSGPKTLRRMIGGLPGMPTGGLDAHGSPALAVVERGKLIVQHRGGTASLALPRDTPPIDETRCVDAVCSTRASYVGFAQGGGIAASGESLVLPYVRTTITTALQCRPYDGPLYPCDPAGPNDTCPEPQQWTCEGPETRAWELRLARVQGTKIEDLSLSAPLGLGEREVSVWDVATDAQGSIHLLIDAAEEGGGHALRYLRLDGATASGTVPQRGTVPKRRSPSPAIALDRLSETELGLAGFSTHAEAASRPPAFEEGAAWTGGSRGGGWWYAPLSSAGLTTRALEVAFTVEADAACGRPELHLSHAGHRVLARVNAQGLEITTSPETPPVVLPLQGADQKIRLELSPGRASVLVDGGKLLRLELPRADVQDAHGYALFGTLSGCGGAPMASTRWQSVRVD